MAERVIFSVRDLKVKVSSETNEEINTLLSTTVVGSEGGMQYTMRNIAARIANYGQSIRFISVHLKTSLAAVIGTVYRECSLGATNHSCTYLRFLSFRQQYQTEKFVAGKRRRKAENDREDSFRNQTLRIFGKPHLFDYTGVDEESRHLLYCFVEGKNIRSQNLIKQAGFQYLSSFSTIPFSRFWPKSDRRVTVAKPEEYGEVLTQLRKFYSNYSFYFDNCAFHADSYYVLRENGRIIAGLSAVPTEYVIRNVPGAGGWIMMNILPFAPFFRRLFNPGLFRFVSLGYIFFEPGREDALSPLFETVCAVKGINTALTWADIKSTLNKSIISSVSLGTISRMLNPKPGQVYVRFINYTEEDKKEFPDAPVYISGFDFT